MNTLYTRSLTTIYRIFSKTIKYHCFLIEFFHTLKPMVKYSRVENRESILYSGQEKVAVQETTDAMQELQAAENRQFWITSSEGTPETVSYTHLTLPTIYSV